jgi:phosphatidylglycerophosphate synthase
MADTSTLNHGLQKLTRQALGFGLVATLALWLVSLWLSSAFALGDDFVVKTLVLFISAAAWLGLYLPEHLPHRRFGSANLVTLGRLALTALLGGMLGETAEAIAWPVVIIATTVLLLDGVDGWLARRGGLSSAFGARFDMETDALLVLLMAVLCLQLDKTGAWVLLSGAMRYLFVAAGAVWRWLRRPLRESRRRKTVCVLQVLSLLAALAPVVPAPWSSGVAASGLALLCYSFLADAAWLWRRSEQPCTGVDSR